MKSFVAALRTLFLPYGQPPNSPQVIINEDPVRAALQTLYSNKVIADFIFQKSLTDFVYQALVTPAIGRPFLAFGGEESVGLVLSEAFRVTPGTIGAPAQLAVTGDFRLTTKTATFDGTVSIPRGVATVFTGAPALTSGGAGTGVGALSGTFSGWTGGVNTHVFQAGRVYRLTPNWFVANNGGWTAMIAQIRSAGGTILLSNELTIPDNGHLDVNMGTPGYVYNNTAADITCQLNAIIQRRACQTGAAVVQLDATTIEVADIGSTTQYASLAFGALAVA